MEVESEREPFGAIIDNESSSQPVPASIPSPPALVSDITATAAATTSASAASSPATSTRSLKRSAEMMEEDDNEVNNNDNNEQDDRQGTKRKRLSVEQEDSPAGVASTSKEVVVGDGTNAARLVEEMGIELTCGCCTEMCYNPVIVLPCQHYYCGSCYTLWTRNGGLNCPSCRSPVSSIIPSRAIQSLIDVFLRAVPSKARLPREKEQADEIYVAGQSISVPTPRPRSPEITAPQDNDAYYHPCPHCASPNDFNWSCPVPIISPTVNLTFATLLTASVFPAGHARCGSCEHIHAVRAPTSSKCDFCALSFCGLVVPTRCHARRVREQKPLGMDTVMDILGNPEIYDAFGVNAVEFDYLLDYLTSKEISPRHIYAEIVEPLASTSDGWRPLLDRGLFPSVTELERAAPAPPQPPAPNGTPAQDQPSSQTASPETAVDEAIQPDQEMTDTVPEVIQTNESPSLPVAAESNSETVPIAATETGGDSSRDTEMQTDEVRPPTPVVLRPPTPIISRPPTPIIVPDRVPTPPIPEPTLDALPVDVQVQEQPLVIPVAVVIEAPEHLAPASLGNANGSDDEEEDVRDASNSSRSVSPLPPPTSLPAGSTQTTDADVPGAESAGLAAAATTSAPPARRGPHLHRICRGCSAEVFIWGARTWWIKERAKAVENSELAENVRSRKDCPNLGSCNEENDNAHARELNHIPHPPPSASTSYTAAPVPPVDTTGEQAAADVPPVTEGAPTNEIDSASAPQEAPTSPERPSRTGSVAGETMEVDPPLPTAAPAVPVDTTAETRLSLLSVPPVNEDHDMGNTSAPEPELESPENSIPSNSSGLGGLAVDADTTGSSVVMDGGGEYSEKVVHVPGTNEDDVHMVTHEEGEPEILTASSVRAA